MIGRAKTYLAILGVSLLALVLSNGYTYFKAKRFWFDQGVLECEIKNQSATEFLNAALRGAQAKVTNAALDFEAQRRAAQDLERELANERANDADALGRCISDAGWMRYNRAR